MTDAECVTFLQWALPRMGLRWPGFRKVRRQVRRRLTRRLEALSLAGPTEYRAYLAETPAEWTHLDTLCRISISRFYRDRGVYDRLRDDVLPTLAEAARERGTLRCWSAGCASGEEPYTLCLIWERALRPRFPELELRVLASDADPHMLARARAARYPAGCLKDLPPGWREAFEPDGDEYVLGEAVRRPVELRPHDLREELPDETFDLILCRNLVFTYFASELQAKLLERLLARLRVGGVLGIGRKEALPAERADLVPWAPNCNLFRKVE